MGHHPQNRTLLRSPRAPLAPGIPQGPQHTLHPASLALWYFNTGCSIAARKSKQLKGFPRWVSKASVLLSTPSMSTTGGSGSRRIQYIGAPAFSTSLHHENVVLYTSFVNNAFFQLHPSPPPAPPPHTEPWAAPPTSPSAPRSKDGSSTQPPPSAGSSFAFLNTRPPQDTARDFFHPKTSWPMLH